MILGLKDLIVTPFYIIIISVIAYRIRPYVTNRLTQKYFLPALWVRLIGAIALGLIYQFYYQGGDTFNYYRQAGVIYEAFINDPVIGVKLLFADGEFDSETFAYSSRIRWYTSGSEYYVIKVIAFFSIFTSNTYSSVALFFAVFSFIGNWAIFSELSKKYPRIINWLALATLFMPSTIFWGSGILKDTITLGALGLLFWAFFQLIEYRKLNLKLILLITFLLWVIYLIKIYILLCLIPATLLWWYAKNVRSIRNSVLRIAIAPVLVVVFVTVGYFLLDQLTSESDRYNFDSLAKWSYITSYDIRYWTGRDAGSGYDIGIQDGTWKTLLPLAPKAINVSLFRPYLWEVKNPLMLLASLEALFFTCLTVFALFRSSFNKLRQPLMIFLLSFSLAFAFAVGVSTYNFGTLSRYKIPMIPFYGSLVFIQLRKGD